MATRIRKTRDYWAIEGYYAGGWEEVTEESTWKEARERLKEYRENERGTAFRARRRREKLETPTVTNPRSLPTRFIPAKFKTRSGTVSGEVRRNPKTGKVQIRVNPKVAGKLAGYARRANSAEDYPGFKQHAYQVFWGIYSPKWPLGNGYYRTKKEAMERAKEERRKTGHKYAVKKVPHNP